MVLDAISIENNGETKIYHGLQVKLWNSNSSICANDLGTFTSVIFHRFSNLSKGYLYHTSKLEHTFENDIKKKNKIISIKLDNPYIIQENSFIHNLISNNDEEKIYLRPYQIEAINKLKQNWTGIKLLVFPCGTGKTVTFSQYLKESVFKNIFIVSPLTFLVEQTHDIVKTYLPNYKHILVDTNGTSIRYRLPENIFIDKNILLIFFIYYIIKE
jgi:predicted helicase